MNHVLVQGRQVSYEKRGDGPVCFLIHGFGGNHADWHATALLLEKHFTLIIPNLTPLLLVRPGQTPLTFEVHAELVSDFIKLILRELGITKPAFGLGSSYGGALLWATAIQHPQLLSAYTLISPMPPAPYQKLKNNTIRTFIHLARHPLLFYAYLRSPLGRIRLPFIEVLFHAPWLRPEKSRRLAHLTERKIKIIVHVMGCFSWLVLHEDWAFWESRLSLIEKPVRILWGADDHLFKPGENVLLQKCIPGSELTIVDNAGHLAMIEAPEQISQLAKLFFDRFSTVATTA